MTAGAQTRRRRRRPTLVVAAALAGVVAAGWALQAVTSRQDAGAGSLPAAYSITVERGGEVLKRYDLAALHALPQHSVVIDGRQQDGPLLSVVLHDAGVGAYDRLVVRGAGLRDGGRLDLARTQVARGAQIDFSERGTVKVCSPHLPWAAWVRDVLSISVD